MRIAFHKLSVFRVLSLTMLLMGITISGYAQPCTNATQNPAAAQAIPVDGTIFSVATATPDFFDATVLSGETYLVWDIATTVQVSVWGTSNGTGSLGFGAAGANWYVITTPTTGTNMWVDINKNNCNPAPGAATIDVELLPYNITFPAGTHCIGDVITVTGNALKSVVSVQFSGGASANASANTATTFQVTIPAGALSGPVTLTVAMSGAYTDNGISGGGNSLNIETASGVSFVPATGAIGDVITISGSNLLGATNVKINGTAGTGVTVSSTQITFTVAAGTTSGNVTFSDGCGNAVNAGAFTVIAITNFYSKAAGALNLTGSWGSAVNGTGASPGNFTTAGQRFNIRNNAAPTITAAWTVSGGGSGVNVGDGINPCNFTVPAGFSMTGSVLSVNANATLTLNNAAIPVLSASICAPTSTVIFGNAASTTIPGITYGNLTISGTGATYTFGGSSTIAGTLTISTANTVQLNNTANVYTFNIVNLTMSNGTLDGGNTVPAGGADYNSILNITGNFNKTGGTTTNSAGSNILTELNFNGGGLQSFDLNAGTANAYLDVATTVQNNTTLTLNTNLTTTGVIVGANGINFLTVDAGSILIAGTNLIAANSAGSNAVINGTLETANTLGLSGAAGTTLSSTNAPSMLLGVASTIVYNAGGAQVLTARSDYANLTITNTSVSTLAGATTVNGNLSISGSATLACDVNQLTGVAAKTFTAAAGTTLSIGNIGSAVTGLFPSNYTNANITLNATSTVIYQSTGAQTVSAVPTYGNLSFITSGTKTASAGLTVSGNLTITGANFAAGSFTHNLAGNWSNSGTFTAGTSTVTFNSASATAQSLGGTTATTFNNLTVNNTGTGGVIQNTATTVSNIYNAKAGAFNLNSLTLTIGTSPSPGTAITQTAGYIVSETNAAVNPSIIQWNIGTDLSAHVFPFGTAAGVLIPVTFQGSGTGPGIVSVSTRATGSDNTPFAGASDGGAVAAVNNMIDLITGTDGSINYVIDRWWDIQSSLASPIPAVSLSVSYAGTENTMLAPGAILGVQHWTGTAWNDGKAGNGGTFISTGSAGSAAAGAHTVSVSGLTTFSPIILVDITHPLPIELLDFDATCSSGNTKLTWSTATETNNDYFTVEKSQDGANFTGVATVKGSGNSSVVKTYQTTDSELPMAGIVYYRLKQTDYDGKYTFSSVISADCYNLSDAMKIFPNPNQGDHFSVSMGNLGIGKPVLLVLMNMLGETVYSKVVISDMNGSVVAQVVQSDHLPAGIYTVTGSTDNKLYNQRLIVK